MYVLYNVHIPLFAHRQNKILSFHPQRKARLKMKLGFSTRNTEESSNSNTMRKVAFSLRDCLFWLNGFLGIIRVIIAESFFIIPFIKLLVSEYDMHRYIASTISKDKKLRKYSSKDPNQMWMHSKLSYSSCVACCVMALYVLSTLL